ncbi:hypothetical protein SDC9_97002 [bioreactor metagenome]|uniref:Uncharacterized protein n=1 Tax=bioreactor metagenome TaxID=1076179 RepID=A0A645ABH6_9ZZZZ
MISEKGLINISCNACLFSKSRGYNFDGTIRKELFEISLELEITSLVVGLIICTKYLD